MRSLNAQNEDNIMLPNVVIKIRFRVVYDKTKLDDVTAILIRVNCCANYLVTGVMGCLMLVNNGSVVSGQLRFKQF